MGLPDEERFLSAQADRLAGASRKEKLPRCIVLLQPRRDAGLSVMLHFVGGEARRTLNPSRFSGVRKGCIRYWRILPGVSYKSAPKRFRETRSTWKASSHRVIASRSSIQHRIEFPSGSG